MSYFNNFAVDAYDFQITTDTSRKTYLVVDIIRNVRIKKETLENILIYDLYTINDGETPELISERLYGSPFYHWTLMLFNERFDYLSDFPLAQRELEEYVDTKYDSGEGIHHYETRQVNNSSGRTLLQPGLIVDSSFTFTYTDSSVQITLPNSQCTIPITNYEYEERVNEEKRTIKVLAPEVMQELFTKFKDLMA